MAETLARLKASYRNRAESIAALQQQMASAWTGDAGTAAREGAGPLEQALKESAANFDQTVRSMADQSSSWNSAARSVEPVPPMPEKPSPWTTGLKAAIPVAGPFMAADDLRTYQEGVVAHTAASANNVAVMDKYSAATSGNAANIGHDYTVLEPGSASVSLKSSTPSGISGDLSGAPGATHSSAVSGPGAGPVTTSGGPVSGAVPHVNAPSATGAGPTPVSPGGGPPVSTPNVGTGGTTGLGAPTGIAAATNVPPSRSTPSDSTRQGTGRPSFGNSSTRGTSGTSRGGTGTSRSTTGTGPGSGRGGAGLGERAGSRLYGPGAGRAGGGEAAGGGRAAGAADGARALGAGKGTGVGMTGGAAAAAESAAARGTAAGARGGAMGPVAGTGANRGQGAEDEEHQRAAYLQENDPDEVFIGDLGKTTPPVIGE
ncbi:hypothetical protein FHX69_2847 [Prauserella muralis]|nr:hypothetical protein FHX69_2847 [Prauserella muralis]